MIKKSTAIILVIVALLGAIFLIFAFATPTGRTIMNNWSAALHKADDSSKYSTKKEVENTCRSMMASYEADKLIYEQYKTSNSSEKLTWAEEAKMRANKTAATYNEYILKNSYIWEDNIPSDIKYTLSYLE